MNTAISPLFHPVIYKDSYLEVLDETRLPFKQEYILVRDLEGALSVLREMKTRAFGQVLLFYYYALLDVGLRKINNFTAFSKRLDLLTKKFSSCRPTFGFPQIASHLKGIAKQRRGSDFSAGIRASILGYIDSVQRLRLNRVKILSRLLPDSPKIATICNMSGELTALAQELKRQGRFVEFYVSETRPYLQGSRLTAWELKQAGFKVNLFSDIQAATVFLKNNISAVITGSDRSTLNGDIINKAGTYTLAVLAKHFNIPFYCLAQPPGKTRSLKDIKIEFRPAEELLKFGNTYIAPKKQKVLYPAFDITPNELVSKLIFFDGAYAPEDFKRKWQMR